MDFDLIFYVYCCKMGMSERSFWESPLKKVLKLIDIYHDENVLMDADLNQGEYTSGYFGLNEVREIHSMREVEGFVDGV